MTTMTKWKLVWMACGAVVLGLVTAASGHAWGAAHEDMLRFNQPVALPGVVLPAGTYSFDLANPSTSQDVVIVRDAQRGEVFYLGMTGAVQRPSEARANASIILGNAEPLSPPPIAVWYPTGSTTGHAFLYR